MAELITIRMLVLLAFICILIPSLHFETKALINSNSTKYQFSQPFRHNEPDIIFKKYPSSNLANTNLSLTANNEVSSLDSKVIRGTVGNKPEGFVSQQLNFSGRYILLGVGNVSKFSLNSKTDPQVSFGFIVHGNKSNYQLVFVLGALSAREGWTNGTYFERLNPNSLRLIDLSSFISSQGDQYISLDKAVITLQKETTVKFIGFRLALIYHAFPLLH